MIGAPRIECDPLDAVTPTVRQPSANQQVSAGQGGTAMRWKAMRRAVICHRRD